MNIERLINSDTKLKADKIKFTQFRREHDSINHWHRYEFTGKINPNKDSPQQLSYSMTGP